MSETERLNIQMDHGWTIGKNKTLTHNLQQSAQETNPFSKSPAQAASLLCISETYKKSDHCL